MSGEVEADKAHRIGFGILKMDFLLRPEPRRPDFEIITLADQDCLAQRLGRAHLFLRWDHRSRGLVDGPPLSRTAGQAIGYQEIIGAISADGSLDDALDTAVRRTRSFARRQRMWFRRDPRITWLGATANHCALLPAVLATWSS